MPEIHDNAAASRFEMQTEWGLAWLDYHETPGALSLDHAEVPAGARGKGVAGPFVLGVLDMLKADGRRIIPRCSYVQQLLQRHPAYARMTLS